MTSFRQLLFIIKKFIVYCYAYSNNILYIAELKHGTLKTVYYADDLFNPCDSYRENLVNRLKHDPLLTVEWFQCNHMKLNKNKYFLGRNCSKHVYFVIKL